MTNTSSIDVAVSLRLLIVNLDLLGKYSLWDAILGDKKMQNKNVSEEFKAIEKPKFSTHYNTRKV